MPKRLECGLRGPMGSRGPMFLERGSERTFFIAVAYFLPCATLPSAQKLWAFVTTAHLRLFRFPFSQAPPLASRGYDDRSAGFSSVEARGTFAGVG